MINKIYFVFHYNFSAECILQQKLSTVFHYRKLPKIIISININFFFDNIKIISYQCQVSFDYSTPDLARSTAAGIRKTARDHEAYKQPVAAMNHRVVAHKEGIFGVRGIRGTLWWWTVPEPLVSSLKRRTHLCTWTLIYPLKPVIS